MNPPVACRGGLERRGKQETKYLNELEAIAESGVTQVRSEVASQRKGRESEVQRAAACVAEL